MKRSSIVWVVILFAVSALEWQMGRIHERRVCEQEFAASLTSKPIGPETVGFKPLKDLPVMKQIEFTINGEKRKFVVGEIKMFDSSRYRTKSELVMGYDDVAVAEIIRKQ